MSSLTSFKARIAQAAAILTSNGENDAKPVTNEFREFVMAGYNWLGRYINFAETNPLSQQYVEQTLASASNTTAGTLLYYPSTAGMSMGGYKDLSAQLFLSSSSGSLFVYVDGTNMTTNPEWTDITKGVYVRSVNNGGGYVSGSNYTYLTVATGSTTYLVDLHNLNYSKFRFRVQVDYSNVNNIGIYTRQKAL